MNKIDDLAQKVIKLSKNTITVNLRFMDFAINSLSEVSTEDITISTDGDNIIYDPVYVLYKYKYNKNYMNSAYMHVLLHCVFKHFYIDSNIDRVLWDLACDIAVENVINELNLACFDDEKRKNQRVITNKLKNEIGQLTAEKIYAHYRDLNISSEEAYDIHSKFALDEHALWYKKDDDKNDKLKNDKNSDSDNSKSGDSSDEGSNQKPSSASDNIKNNWDDISKRLQTDLETFSKKYSDMSSDFLQNLKSVNKEKYDYSKFLRKFAKVSEVMEINDEEFDYIFYCHGLNLYKNVPLIEPLEYKEDKTVNEFVIAIDTSGSVMGDKVKEFVNKTYNILKQEECFSKKINIRIIQCDCEIKEDVKIESQEDFDRYIENMVLKGFGGTDFRPVFEHIDELRRKGEFKDLKGLIYFTDGYGLFPKKQPDYKTAFIFVEDEYKEVVVPVWAIKLVLQSHEVEDGF